MDEVAQGNAPAHLKGITVLAIAVEQGTYYDYYEGLDKILREDAGTAQRDGLKAYDRAWDSKSATSPLFSMLRPNFSRMIFNAQLSDARLRALTIKHALLAYRKTKGKNAPNLAALNPFFNVPEDPINEAEPWGYNGSIHYSIGWDGVNDKGAIKATDDVTSKGDLVF